MKESKNDVTSGWGGRAVLLAKPGGLNTGVGRYANMLHKGLRELHVEADRLAPSVPPFPDIGYAALSRAGVDARAFFNNYPIWAQYSGAEVYHLTSQNLASLLQMRRPRGRVIVTVHDIIPFMLRDDTELSSYRTVADRYFDRLAMRGLKLADRIISDSSYTKRCLINYLGIPESQIDVIYLGIDHERFRQAPVPAAFYERYGLSRDRSYMLYVGSEDPRKNLTTLVRALARLRGNNMQIELIKVGRAHFDYQRTKLNQLARELGVQSAIHFLDEVPEADLPLLYNVANVCVMPSLYEGFGFPVLEAMACGTPVVCARAASLPELAGDAGLLFEPGEDSVELAQAVRSVLEQQDLRNYLRSRGITRANQFRWSNCVLQVLDIYRQNELCEYQTLPKREPA